MAEVNRRLTDLEAALGEYMAQNALAARRARIEQYQRDSEQARRDEETREFKNDMKIEQARRDEEMREFKSEMKVFGDRVDKSIESMNKKWGDLANKLGTIVEDIVAPSIPTVAAKYFGIAEYDKLLINAYIRSSVNRSVRREFDVVLVGETLVLWNETKTTARQDYMEQFIAALPSFYDFFPEYAGKTLVPIFSSLKLTPDQVRFLSNNKIYAMAMMGNVMDIVNFSDITQP